MFHPEPVPQAALKCREKLHVLATSTQGRPISARIFGTQRAAWRVLLIAGQHGDEGLSSLSLRALLESAEIRERCRREELGLAVICTANPDGSALGQRKNADGLDLNRDHLLLRSTETQALHHFALRWRPDLVVDVHEYPPRRRQLLKHGLVLDRQVLVEAATHCGAQPDQADDTSSITHELIQELQQVGVSCARYLVADRHGRLRHGTTDIQDARNALSIRLGVPSFLVELRSISPHDSQWTAQRCIETGARALARLLNWSLSRRELLSAHIRRPAPGDLLPLMRRYVRSGPPTQRPFRAVNGQRHAPSNGPDFRCRIEARRHRRLPRAYAVPESEHELLQVLRRHSFELRPAKTFGQLTVAVMRRASEQSYASQARAHLTWERRRLPKHLLVNTDSNASTMLALMLEADSPYALLRRPDLNRSHADQPDYPILRVE